MIQYGSHPPKQHLAQWARATSVSPLQEMLALSGDSRVLSLALGLPDPSLFPARELANATQGVLEENPGAVQYQDPTRSALKEFIREIMRLRGVECTTEQIFLTSGAQQALSVIARLFLDEGSTTVEERFSYTGFQQAIEPFRPHVLAIPSDADDGVDIERLDQALCEHPEARLAYVMAEGHNPLALCLTRERRQKLAEVARRRRIPLIEDDVYGLLQYDGDLIPPIRAFGDDWVWYVGSFSKILAPALRLGWLLAPPSLIPMLSIIKESMDINTITFSQRVACRYLEEHSLREHLAEIQSCYRAKRDAMDSALCKCLPPYCTWRKPRAGVFFWIQLPDAMDAGEILKLALSRYRVAFLPAAAFSRGIIRNGIRLCFSRCSLAEIHAGVKSLAAALWAYSASRESSASNDLKFAQGAR